MSKLFKLKMACVVALLLVVLWVQAAQADETDADINVRLNGEKINFDVNPRIFEGKVMIPIRGIFETLKIDLEWNSRTRTVTGCKGETKVVLQIDSNTVLVNGKKVVLDASAQIIEDRTLVPLDFVSDCIDDVRVEWDEQTGNIDLKVYKDDKGTLYPFRPVMFLGDSLTQGLPISGSFEGYPIINKGINANTTKQMLERLGPALEVRPSKFFIMAGTNDIWSGEKIETIVKNYETIIDTVYKTVPDCRVYIQSTLPYGQAALSRNRYASNDKVTLLNASLVKLAADKKGVFIDTAGLYRNDKGQMKPECTIDGIHLVPEYYSLWLDLLKKYMH